MSTTSEIDALIDAKCPCRHRVFPDWHDRYGCAEDDCDCPLTRPQALLASDWLAAREAAAAQAVRDQVEAVLPSPRVGDHGMVPVGAIRAALRSGAGS